MFLAASYLSFVQYLTFGGDYQRLATSRPVPEEAAQRLQTAMTTWSASLYRTINFPRKQPQLRWVPPTSPE